MSRPIYPWLLAGYLVLMLIAQRPIPVRAADLVGSLGAAVAWAALLWVVLARYGDRHRQAWWVSVGVAWAGLFGSFHVLAAVAVPALARAGIALGVWTVVLGAVAYAVGRSPLPWARITRAMNVALAILVATSGVTLANRSQPPLSRAAEVFAAPDAVGHQPDVYVIVLDKYSHPRWLAAEYGLDVRPFLDSLRALGFVIPDSARTNYIHTSLVLATLLNGSYVHEDLPSGAAWYEVAQLIERNRLQEMLRRRGYRSAFFPSTFPTTRTSEVADIVLSAPGDRTARWADTWLVNSPWPTVAHRGCRLLRCTAPAVFPYPIETAAQLEWKLDILPTLADTAGSIFAFLHLLAPHEPWVFDAACRHRRPNWPASDVGPAGRSVRSDYAVQVACVNQLVLRAVSTLLERSRTPPVIILQSDHGHARIAIDPMRGLTIPLIDLPAAQVSERLDVFAAYRMPQATRGNVWPTISPVNVMGVVLEAVTGEPIRRQPDRSFWSTFQRPLHVVEVRP